MRRIIVYVCNEEFDVFEGVEKSIGRVSQYKYKAQCDGDYCFIAVKDKGKGDSGCFSAKKKVKSHLDNGSSQDYTLLNDLSGYLGVIRIIVQNYLNDPTESLHSPVIVITHWGGGTPTMVDKMETVISDAFTRMSFDVRFKGWETWSASETMRPGLFSPEYNTAMARAHEKTAKLPDAKECERILQRLKDKNYGTPFVDIEEKDEKILFYDIMKHLNH